MVNLGWVAVARRNSRVWKKLMFPSLLGNFAEPLLYLVAIGYGLGQFVGKLEGLDYVLFLATGIVCSNAMNVASFEGMYSAYARMAVQKTWEGMLMTPLSISDIVLGESIWSAIKTVINSVCILLVVWGLGLIPFYRILPALPVLFLSGLSFAMMALVVTSFAKGYDFFSYYMSLFLSPMMLLSGVFFPLTQLPLPLQWIMNLFPLTHTVAIIRPLLSGQPLVGVAGHLVVIVTYLLLAYFVAVWSLRRRLIK